MHVCPLCNGLAAIEKKCPGCAQAMSDAGVIQDYYDNYSPYEEREFYEDGYRCHDGGYCTHLFCCPDCHIDLSLSIQTVGEEQLLD